MVHFLIYRIGHVLAKYLRVGRKATKGKHTRFCLFSSVSNASGNQKSIQIGEKNLMFGQLITEKQGTIKTGKYVEIEARSIVQAMSSVEIGNHCKIAEMVYIHDNNSHPIDPDERREELIASINGAKLKRENVASAPIKIEDDVFIGRRAMIYKGVTIGRGSIVAAGAVVTKDIPPYSLAAGNPAQVVKTYKPSKNA